MNMKTVVLASLLAFTLTGCSALNSATVSEEKLKEKAAFALNTDASAVKISNRSNEGVQINFTATVGKRSHQGYVTNALTFFGPATSGAVCNGGSGGTAKSTGSCNDLLRAAGQCS